MYNNNNNNNVYNNNNNNNGVYLAPEPRAGMSLASIDDNLYLFGGSGVAAKCYNDLMVFEVCS